MRRIAQPNKADLNFAMGVTSLVMTEQNLNRALYGEARQAHLIAWLIYLSTLAHAFA
ncbi:hypothetical protein LBC_16180 [Campylobacter sp. 19-13652]|nr:hypothetical protein LBC_16180 [Campylobacter sp. 19-13652]